nr:immunoglobulin light chain junction region [Macaca mulatta]MOW07933.1 immunoglobulin light chain junction region [Macaca mulatta]MOW07950.1 immunoglobulin light chain junction region [Macaca mulatta]MOW07959.1 immunoglobulin light chain junction region [Macaca mulatta]MOW07989.1 immunoglobulin light chain junction region [Macaca mulatta]
CMQGTELWTF